MPYGCPVMDLPFLQVSWHPVTACPIIFGIPQSQKRDSPGKARKGSVRRSILSVSPWAIPGVRDDFPLINIVCRPEVVLVCVSVRVFLFACRIRAESYLRSLRFIG